MSALVAIFSGNAQPFEREMKRVEAVAEKVGHSIQHHIAGAISVAAIEHVVRSTVEWGEKVSVLSQRLGISTDAVQAWDYALKQNGTSIDAAATFFEKLAIARQKAMHGQEEQINAFRRLGVTIEDLRSKRLEDLAGQIAEAFKVGDPQQLIADLREVGGRGAGELAAAFASGLSDLTKEAQDAGIIISESVIDKLREAADKSKTIWAEFVSGIAPAITWLLDKIEAIWRGLNMTFRMAAGFLYGGKEGADFAQKEYADELAKKDAALEKERQNRKKTLTGGFDEEPMGPTRADMKRMDDEAERLDELRERNNQATMTRAQRIARLKELKANAEAVASDPMFSKEDQIKAGIKGQEYQKEILELERKRHTHGHVNALQQVGAFAAGQISVLDVNKKMEKHLSDINAKMGTRQNFGTVRW